MSGNTAVIKGNRNGKIELLKLIFAILVMLFHSAACMVDGIRIMVPGARAIIPFFFIVSGYLMAVSISNIIKNNSTYGVGKETEKFLRKKFTSLITPVVISILMTITVDAIVSKMAFSEAIIKMVKGIPTMFMVNMTGLRFYNINGTWYIAAMLIGMAILFPLYLKFPKFMKTVGMLLIGLFILGYMMKNFGSLIGEGGTYLTFTYKGNLTAISGLAIGCVTYSLSEKIKTINFTFFGRVLLTILEAVLYIVAIIYVIYFNASKWDFILPFVLGLAIAISFSKLSFGSTFFDNKVCYFFGKASLYLYLGHQAALINLDFIVGKEAGNGERLLVFIILAIVFTAILWGLCILWRKAYPFLKKCVIVRT